MKLSFDFPKPDIITLMITLSLLSAGLFHDFAACIAGVFIAVYLIVTVIKNKRFVFRLNTLSVACIVFVLFYGLSTLWAVDKGMAFIGFLKFLPLLLFLLCIMQKETIIKTAIGFLPLFAAVSVIITSVLGLIPSFSKLFCPDGRLSGFLQYPNTFAIFLLVSALLLFKKQKLYVWDTVIFLIILFGIFYTGSRTAFVITVLCAVALLLFSGSKRTRFIFICALLIAVIIALLLGTVFKDVGGFDRFKNISLDNFSLAGRLLFASDSLKLIAKNPFGLGYMGYFFMHREIQTGPYSVTSVHNELLQFILDTGLLAGILMFAALCIPIFAKKTELYKRLALAALILHSLLDFDFQFVALFFIAILLAYRNDGRVFTIKGISVTMLSALIICVCLFGYFGSALTLYAFGNYDGCHKLYPWHTQNEIERLSQTRDAAAMDAQADYLLSLNDKVAVAYSAKARAAYSEGDFEKVITYKQKVFELVPFNFTEYQDYCYMLMDGVRLYRKVGDEYSAQVCIDEILNTKATLDKINDTRSELSKRYYRLKTKLDESILEFIEKEI